MSHITIIDILIVIIIIIIIIFSMIISIYTIAENKVINVTLDIDRVPFQRIYYRLDADGCSSE